MKVPFAFRTCEWGGGAFRGEYLYEDDEPVSLNLHPLADSFEEFLKKIVPIPTIYCPVNELAKHGDVNDLVEFLRAGEAIDSKSRFGNSLLCEAILVGNTAIVKECIKAGAKLNGSIKAAVQSRCPDLLHLIIEAGADVEELDEFGRPPIDEVLGTSLPGEEGATNRKLKTMLLRATRAQQHRGQ